MLQTTPKVSIIIPFFNAFETLPACLQSLDKLNYPNLELLFIDDCSTDSGFEVVQQFTDSWCDGERKHKTFARTFTEKYKEDRKSVKPRNLCTVLNFRLYGS